MHCFRASPPLALSPPILMCAASLSLKRIERHLTIIKSVAVILDCTHFVVMCCVVISICGIVCILLKNYYNLMIMLNMVTVIVWCSIHACTKPIHDSYTLICTRNSSSTSCLYSVYSCMINNMVVRNIIIYIAWHSVVLNCHTILVTFNTSNNNMTNFMQEISDLSQR